VDVGSAVEGDLLEQDRGSVGRGELEPQIAARGMDDVDAHQEPLDHAVVGDRQRRDDPHAVFRNRDHARGALEQRGLAARRQLAVRKDSACGHHLADHAGMRAVVEEAVGSEQLPGHRREGWIRRRGED
jgi:hypothetical protein